MPITKTDLESALRARFPEADIALTDMAGDNDHWQATITSAIFKGKSRLEQHRMVQDAVKGHDIHALAITTKVASP